MICSPISEHLRGGMALVGAPTWKRQLPGAPPPRHRQRASAGESVGTVVQLNSDGLDPAHGLKLLQSLLPSFKFKVEIFNISYDIVALAVPQPVSHGRTQAEPECHIWNP